MMESVFVRFIRMHYPPKHCEDKIMVEYDDMENEDLVMTDVVSIYLKG